MDQLSHQIRMSLPVQPKILRGKNKILRKPESISNQYTKQFMPIFRQTQSPQRNPSYKQQIATNASLFSLPYQSEDKRRGLTDESLRKKLDKHLKFVEQSLSNRRYSLEYKNSSINRDERLRGPTIQRDLVEKYLQNIYSDFSIPKFDERWTSRLLNYEEKLEFLKTQPLRQIQKQRYNYHVTQQIQINKVPKNSAYSLKQKLITELTPRNSSQQQKFRFPDKKQFKNQQRRTQIPQIFRYCFACQQPILSANIEIHQRLKCTQLKSLYQLKLENIKQALISKIQRIRKQCSQLYANIFQNQNQPTKQKMRKNLMRQICEYLKFSEVLQNKENKFEIKNCFDKSFERVSNIFELSYLKLYENLRKLQWFSHMLLHLQKIKDTESKELKKNKQINQSYLIFS